MSAQQLVGEDLRRRVASCIQAIYAAGYARNDNSPCRIEEGLYLGSVGAALNKAVLKELNITHILTVAKSLNPAYPDDFIYKKVEVLDTPETKLKDYFEECFNFIDEAQNSGGGVLVHCFAGKSRSVTVVSAYLMKKHHMNHKDALSLVRTSRPAASPNPGFVAQLRNYERSLIDVFRVDCWDSSSGQYGHHLYLQRMKIQTLGDSRPMWCLLARYGIHTIPLTSLIYRFKDY